MKTGIIFVSMAASVIAAITDPVASYLQTAAKENGYISSYRSDDHLASLALDIDGDGQQEMLVTLSRDNSGKEGNRWQVFKKQDDGWVRLDGNAVFSAGHFYLGPIDGGKTGIVSFWPAGAGDITLTAYYLDGGAVVSKALGQVHYDSANAQYHDSHGLSEKYTGSGVRSATELLKVIEGRDFPRLYGVAIDDSSGAPAVQPRTNRLDEQVQVPAPPEKSKDIQSKLPEKAPASGKKPEPQDSGPMFWAILLVALVLAGGAIVWAKARKR